MNVLYEALGEVRTLPYRVVPNVIGKRLPEAWVLVASAELAADVPPSAPMTARVIAQHPAAGSRVAINSIVLLNVNPCDGCSLRP
jgi:hypothetical protein